MNTLLRLDGLTKQFSGLLAVNNVSLDLYEGEILGLIGPNGAGKTTLFNMISGRLPPTSGDVYFEGQKITGLAPHRACRHGIARTFQIARPFARLSVLENVKVGAYLWHHKSAVAEARAREVLNFTGLEKVAEQPASNLTTARRKRLELARALCTEPRLLLLDEVMAGLTATESAAIVNLISDIRQRGISILVIEHVMKAVMSLSDRVAVLHHGELIAVDTPAEIATNERVIESYLGEEYVFAAS